ncbi:MAG: 2,3-bisphosphoglycerate-independent phosphoglycerate mutase [Elusimicrobiota bacterium]
MKNLLLVILDGWGHSGVLKGNAVAGAHKPTFEKLWDTCPHAILHASGVQVGLPEGQIGSSEVGHSIIGAGRNVAQLSTTITKAVRSGVFFNNIALRSAVAHARDNGKKFHVIGLTSDGGVHSYWEHMIAILKLAKQEGLPADDLAVHAILDGRDVGPKTGKAYIEQLAGELRALGAGKIASVCGRYWAMDRDKRWDRTAKAYRTIVLAEGPRTRDAAAAVGDSYFAGKTDEFMEPVVVVGPSGPVAPIADGDGVIFFNFRADRARQIVRALTDPGFHEFERAAKPNVHLVCMTQYDGAFNLPVAFAPEPLDGPLRLPGLAEVISERKLCQLRIAETEKYAHVTYFFSGGRESALPLEDRAVVPSPKVSTYDQTPEMSARAITDKLMETLPKYSFCVCNFSNADMVGHTGVYDVAVKACEFVDQCLGRIVKRLENLDTTLVLTADHGNSEIMFNDFGQPHTAHTTSPVPFLIWKKNSAALTLRQDQDIGLKDIAPTILELIGLAVPSGWEGKSLIKK